MSSWPKAGEAAAAVVEVAASAAAWEVVVGWAAAWEEAADARWVAWAAAAFAAARWEVVVFAAAVPSAECVVVRLGAVVSGAVLSGVGFAAVLGPWGAAGLWEAWPEGCRVADSDRLAAASVAAFLQDEVSAAESGLSLVQVFEPLPRHAAACRAA